MKVNFDSIYRISEDIVARDLHGEFVIIPIVSGIGDLEDEIFTVNNTGKEIWFRLDGKKTLRDIAEEIFEEFQSSFEELEEDVVGFVTELARRKIVIEVS